MNIKATLVGAAAACSIAFVADAETLVPANADAIGSPMDLMNKHFAALVEERSSGDIEVNYITGAQLGTPPQVMDRVASGSVDAMGTTAPWLSAYAPDTRILTRGFTFRDSDHVFKFFASDLFDDLTRDMQEKDRIRVLSAGPTAPRSAVMVKKPGADGGFDGR
jgi:TRAP-type C4-dicarboxylate transport system substrate-binding protein